MKVQILQSHYEDFCHEEMLTGVGEGNTGAEPNLGIGVVAVPSVLFQDQWQRLSTTSSSSMTSTSSALSSTLHSPGHQSS